MADFMSHVSVPIAIGAVAVMLLLGLVNMMRGGSGNTSQKLMRLRVLLQFIAIVVIMFYALADGKITKDACARTRLKTVLCVSRLRVYVMQNEQML